MDKKQVIDLLQSQRPPEQRESHPEHFLDPKETPQVAPPQPERVQPQVEQEMTELNQPRQSEQGEKNKDNAISKLKGLLSSSKKSKQKQIIPQVRDEIVLQVEHILEDGLSDAFSELSPIEQQEFKIKGEETAFAIRDMMRRHKIKVRSIFQLIFNWLKMLPGVNKFFLQQEAKIKVDKIVSLHKRSNHKQF